VVDKPNEQAGMMSVPACFEFFLWNITNAQTLSSFFGRNHQNTLRHQKGNQMAWEMILLISFEQNTFSQIYVGMKSNQGQLNILSLTSIT
jgi:hypothetical protein